MTESLIKEFQKKNSPTVPYN